jgi:hypothetical protein
MFNKQDTKAVKFNLILQYYMLRHDFIQLLPRQEIDSKMKNHEYFREQ